ncbi:MAG: VOC family protein, partial [Desulfobacterales bacterium]
MKDGKEKSRSRDTLYKQIDHIALAVYDIEQAAKLFTDAFQLDTVMGLSYPPDGVHTNLVFSLGPQNELELMAPLGEKGFLAEFLKKHGEGFHHLALQMTDIDQATR